MITLAMSTDFFAARLKELRAAAGITQAVLAERSGLAEATVKQFEIGRREPGFETLLKLAAGLGVSLSAFDRPEPPPARGKGGRKRKPPTPDVEE